MTDDEVNLFKTSSVHSFRLAFELFNRPHESGRANAVLIHLNHAFEMLLKASILSRGGLIREENGEGDTIGFKSCVNIAVNGAHEIPDIDFISESEAYLLRTINQCRNAVMHEYIDISEHQLYLQARQGVEVFDDILSDVFEETVADYMPERILPLSTQYPTDIFTAIQRDYEKVEELLETGSTTEARARLRSIESIERALDSNDESPSKSELDRKLDGIDGGADVAETFPNIVRLGEVNGNDGATEAPAIPVKITDEGPPVRYATESEGVDDVNLFREVNPHDRFSMDYFGLAENLSDRLDRDISWMKTKATMKELGLLEDDEYFRELSTGGTGTRQAIHPRTLDRLHEAISTKEIDVEQAWENHKSELFDYD